MPALPPGAEDGVVRGLYRFREAPSVAGARKPPRATILASGSIMQEALRAQTLLAEQLGVAAEVWSATSYQLLRADALEIERWNRLHPGEPARVPFVAEQLAEPAAHGPVVAVSDFMKAVPDQIARWVPGDAGPCWGPTGSAAATRAPSCGASSRSMRPTSRRRWWPSLPAAVDSMQPRPARPGRAWASTRRRRTRRPADAPRPERGLGSPACLAGFAGLLLALLESQPAFVQAHSITGRFPRPCPSVPISPVPRSRWPCRSAWS